MKQGSVCFVGAGPGDPELLTIKGKKAIDAADVIIYAGSLVNPAVLRDKKKDAVVYDSAGMTLEEVGAIMLAAAGEGKRVARVHTGDPSIYGAIREQMDILSKNNITFAVIPGVSSFAAAAAAVCAEFTLPGVSQTVILTRIAGRTGVPEAEDLEKLAAHKASMAIFLSVASIKEVCARLTSHYTFDTPVAVVYKASWPEEKIVSGTLGDIAEKVMDADISRMAQILVGDFLGTEYELSRLYDKNFSHGYRKAADE